MKYEGIFIAATTPFKNEKIDFDALAYNFDIWNKSNVTGYVILGSTSEFVSLTYAEKIKLMKTARNLIPNDKVMLAGVGCHSVFETVHLAEQAANFGADGLLIVTPHYYIVKITTELLRHYYLAVADKVSLPIFLYNIPQFTGVNISTELVKVLCQHDKIVGTKDSTGDLSRIFELVESGEEINVLVGDINSLVASLQMKADGAILAVGNTFPQELCEVYRLCKQNRTEEAIKKMTRIIKLTKETIGKFGIPGLKELMKLLNYQPGDPRMPFHPVNEKQASEIAKAYEQYSQSNQ